MSEMFDPEELLELRDRLDSIAMGEKEGYEMVFFINRNDALELLEAYELALNGEPMAMARCWTEFAQIMARLEASIHDADN